MAKEGNSGIYEIVNLVNGKRYIGSAVDIAARWRYHLFDLRKNRHHSIALQRAWRKYGPDNFDFRILLRCSRDRLIECEQSAFDQYKPEYNISHTAGSSLGVIRSHEFREKLRVARLGKRATGETREKMSACAKGRIMPPDVIAKRSATRKGRKMGPQTEEHKAKISAAHTGKKLSAEHAAAISRGKLGKSRPDMLCNRWGVFFKTEEHRRQMSAARKGRCVSPETGERMKEAWVLRKARRAKG